VPNADRSLKYIWVVVKRLVVWLRYEGEPSPSWEICQAAGIHFTKKDAGDAVVHFMKQRVTGWEYKARRYKRG